MNDNVVLDVLARIFPFETEFSEREKAVARWFLCGGDDVKDVRRPVTFVPVGGLVTVGWRRYRCVEVPVNIHPADYCRGCDISGARSYCSHLQCSKFDRRDGKFVRFEEA